MFSVRSVDDIFGGAFAWRDTTFCRKRAFGVIASQLIPW
jgi:hypothetical protein